MKYKIKTSIVCYVLLVVTLGAAYALWNSKFSPIAKVEDTVRNALVDSDSAKFEETVINSKTGSACGYVNSKNRMGGYVGMTLFIVAKDGAVTFSPNGDTESSDSERKLAALVEKLEFMKKAHAECDA